MLLNLDHLKAFYVAAIRRNFSETGKTLNLSQSSVSLYIRELEDQLQVKLFERTTRTMKLTDAGRILYRYAERIFPLIENAQKEMTLLSQSVHGELQIGASTTIGERVLPYLLGKFKSIYPRVNLVMKIGNSGEILRQIDTGEVQIGFVEANYSNPKLHNQPFMEDELVVIASRNHSNPLMQYVGYMTPSDLLTLPIILRERGSGTRKVIEESLKSIQLEPSDLNVVLELGNTESVKAAVESGIGISILSRSAIQKELQLGTLQEIKFVGMKLHRFFYMVYEKQKVLSPAAETFINFIILQSEKRIINGETTDSDLR